MDTQYFKEIQQLDIDFILTRYGLAFEQCQVFDMKKLLHAIIEMLVNTPLKDWSNLFYINKTQKKAFDKILNFYWGDKLEKTVLPSRAKESSNGKVTSQDNGDFLANCRKNLEEIFHNAPARYVIAAFTLKLYESMYPELQKFDDILEGSVYYGAKAVLFGEDREIWKQKLCIPDSLLKMMQLNKNGVDQEKTDEEELGSEQFQQIITKAKKTFGSQENVYEKLDSVLDFFEVFKKCEKHPGFVIDSMQYLLGIGKYSPSIAVEDESTEKFFETREGCELNLDFFAQAYNSKFKPDDCLNILRVLRVIIKFFGKTPCKDWHLYFTRKGQDTVHFCSINSMYWGENYAQSSNFFGWYYARRPSVDRNTPISSAQYLWGFMETSKLIGQYICHQDAADIAAFLCYKIFDIKCPLATPELRATILGTEIVKRALMFTESQNQDICSRKIVLPESLLVHL